MEFSNQKSIKTSIVLEKNKVMEYLASAKKDSDSLREIKKSSRNMKANESSCFVGYNGSCVGYNGSCVVRNAPTTFYNNSLLMGNSHMGLSDSFKYGNQLS